MVLRNFVVLENESPALLHFNSVTRERRTITERTTGDEKEIFVLVFGVDELNGSRVQAIFSVTSEKLAQTLQPWLHGGRYKTVDFVITRSGSGFGTVYQVQTRSR